MEIRSTEPRVQTLTTCLSTGQLLVPVTCPFGTPNLIADPATKGKFDWIGPIDYAYGEGTIGSYAPSYTTTHQGSGLFGATHTVTGDNKWLLVRSDMAVGPLCNQGPGPYDSGVGTDSTARDAGGSSLP